MKKTLALILLILAASILFLIRAKYHQQKKDKTSAIALSWTMSPALIDNLTLPVSFFFHVSDNAQKPIADAEIDLIANMTHPGMVPLTAKVRPLGKGDYSSQLLLSMQGDWILFLTIKLKDGMTVKKEIFFKTAQ